MAIQLKKSLLAAALIMVAVPSTAYAAACTLYQHRDFGGSYYELRSGESMIMTGGETTCMMSGGRTTSCEYHEPSWNDQVSSIGVQSGCTLTLWQHINRQGAHFRATRSYTYLGDNWNDQASEASCTCR